MVIRRRRRSRQFLLGRFYLNPGAQYSTTVISAILLSAFVFSGFLLFRLSDTQDLLLRGKHEMALGKVAFAAKTFESLVNKHPDSYEGHLLLGQAYLQLGERNHAEREFMAAAALHNKGGKNRMETGLALSKLAMARKDYHAAEVQLMTLYNKQPSNSTIKQALFDLYQDWAERLLDDQKPLDQVLAQYENAYQYVSRVDQQEQLKISWLEVIHRYATEQDKLKHYDQAITSLQRSLKLRYDPEVLIQVAELYEKKQSLDDAIIWYRKAFDANPSVISLKLSSLLIKKGQQLIADHQTDEAEKLFNEARQVSRAANVPMESIFPVKLSQAHLTYESDSQTGEIQPNYQVTMENGAHEKPLIYLLARAQFYANDQLLADVKQPVVSATDKPLAAGEKRALVFKPTDSLNLYQLEDKPLVVKLSVAYVDGDPPPWKFLRADSITVKSSDLVPPLPPPLTNPPTLPSNTGQRGRAD